MFGIGLVDCFIIIGAYCRTDPGLEPEERIRKSMLEIGVSITATTLTTMSAFMLGKLPSCSLVVTKEVDVES